MSPLDQFELRKRFRVPSSMSRRDFLALMGASAALAGLSGCRNKMPAEEIIAYASASGQQGAGVPRFYATTFPLAGWVQGLLVESHDGHPTKIEGNPEHPMSRGATSLFAQASILDLYSPHRLKNPQKKGQAGDWVQFQTELANVVDHHKTNGGAGLALVTDEVTSPTLRSQIEMFRRLYPTARWYVDDTISRDTIHRGLQSELGYAAEPIPLFDRTTRILSVGCDFLGLESFGVARAADFTSARRKQNGRSRLYVIEPILSVTGTKADQRWAFSTPEIFAFLDRFEHELTSGRPKSGRSPDLGDSPRNQVIASAARTIASDFKDRGDECLILAGFTLPPDVHSRVHQLNGKLGAIGRGIDYQPVRVAPSDGGLSQLSADLQAGLIESLIVLGGNPVFTAPRDLDLRTAFRNPRCTFSAHLTAAANETSEHVLWSLPESHYLETWSDAESLDGTESLVQPLLAPLGSSMSAHDLLNWMNGKSDSTYETVRSYWRERTRGSDFERAWTQALRDGKWPDSVSPSPRVRSRLPDRRVPPKDSREDFRVPQEAPVSAPTGPLEFVFTPDPTVWDGRFVENPWLQELPKPPTQICWDNAVLIAPATAAHFKIETGDLIEIRTPHGKLKAAAFVFPGTAPNTLSLSLGYGRERSSPVAENTGFDANPLRSARDPWRAEIISLQKTGDRYELACTQTHHQVDGRGLYRVTNPDQDMNHGVNESSERGHGIGVGQPDERLPSAMHSESAQWAMSIDLDSCIGCSVCVIACQAENNIPVVGKRQVLLGREMHWIRIDRYVSGIPGTESASPLPVTCMHCETAPCEVVCPVAATNHSSDGLNQMVYNRCVGTRYCSNNCPYKVRRFNFFKFSEGMNGSLSAQRNPDVTVRSRGVMEKCTYCVQRIERARIEADKESRSIRAGEIQTACQQSCPTNAIVFGNLKDAGSPIHATRSSSRTYGLLTELGTKPRTTYLARIANPHPNPEVMK